MPNRQPIYQPLIFSVCLALLLLAAYNANFRHGTTVDTISTSALPISILHEGNLDLDEFRDLLSRNTHALDYSLNYFGGIQERNGHLISSYPFGAALLAIPFFWVADHLNYLHEWHHYRVTAKIAASFLVTLSAVFIYLTLRETLSNQSAWFIALLFGLGTSAWPLSSQELWQHGPGALCLAIAMYAITRFRSRQQQYLAATAGFFLGFAILCRLLNIIPAAALSCFFLFHHRRHLIAFALPLAAITLAFLFYNFSVFGDASGGYDAIYHSQWHAWRGLNAHNVYSNPLLLGLADILVSPSRGLFIYSPFLIPAYVAVFYFLIRPTQPLQRYVALWVILISIVLAKNALWWGGSSFGPRYFSEACVALAILTGELWPHLTAKSSYRALMLASAILSVVINGIGAYFSPCGWAEQPTLVDRDPDRLWNWRDPEILRCIKFAVYNGFQTPEILRYKSGDSDL